MAEEHQTTSGKKPLHWLVTLAICIVILGVAAGVIFMIYFTEPTATRTGATRESAMLVEVIQVRRGDYRPDIRVLGIVEPARDVVLNPRVGGHVLERAPSFTPGGFVEEGEVLLRIDPADYENTLEQRKSELRQAIADLDIEKGRQLVAQQDYELIGEELANQSPDLLLRKPQLSAAEATVESARAAVRQAELDLERTAVKAPFDALVISRNANVGSQVSTGDDLGRLVGLDEYWVVATVPLSKLRFVAFPGPDQEGSTVRVHHTAAWPEGTYREGKVENLVGILDERTRLARVLVTISDPLSRHERAGQPPLIIGSVLETRIVGKSIEDAIKLSRDYVRADDTVWVMKDEKLEITEVVIDFRDAEHAYITSGLEDGAMVVTTSLSAVVEGAALRLQENEPELPEAEPEEREAGQ